MSRTYRRKGRTPNWVKVDWVLESYWIKIVKPDNECKKSVARYHSDNYDPCTPDKEFRRLYSNKYTRNATKVCLRKELSSLEYGNIIYPKYPDINWFWY